MQPESEPKDDPFLESRRTAGAIQCPFQGENITMLLRHADVRNAAANWRQFSSDAPFRVPVPSEEAVRSVRQLPIEVDPPDHQEYRELTQPFFLRAKRPEVMQAVRQMMESEIDRLIQLDSFDAVQDLAIPIQSRALTHLLNVPASEAEVWISWGVHVFQPKEGEFKAGDILETYLQKRFDQAEATPGEDFFSALTQAEFQGRKLTRDECIGFANLAFAGGRDTIIHSITSIIAWLAEHPHAFDFLREDPQRITLASEEFFRVFMPLTQIGRVCRDAVHIHGFNVAPDERIGLCWASANRDESVFENAHKVILDRRPNPHVSFGFRDHLCQGAAHARLVIRTLLSILCEQQLEIEVLNSVRHVEAEKEYSRSVGYDALEVRLRRNPDL